jgi:hypothetical protein
MVRETSVGRELADLSCEVSFIARYEASSVLICLRIVRQIALGHALVQSFHALQIMSSIIEANWQSM